MLNTVHNLDKSRKDSREIVNNIKKGNFDEVKKITSSEKNDLHFILQENNDAASEEIIMSGDSELIKDTLKKIEHLPNQKLTFLFKFINRRPEELGAAIEDADLIEKIFSTARKDTNLEKNYFLDKKMLEFAIENGSQELVTKALEKFEPEPKAKFFEENGHRLIASAIDNEQLSLASSLLSAAKETNILNKIFSATSHPSLFEEAFKKSGTKEGKEFLNEIITAAAGVGKLDGILENKDSRLFLDVMEKGSEELASNVLDNISPEQKGEFLAKNGHALISHAIKNNRMSVAGSLLSAAKETGKLDDVLRRDDPNLFAEILKNKNAGALKNTIMKNEGVDVNRTSNNQQTPLNNATKSQGQER